MEFKNFIFQPGKPWKTIVHCKCQSKDKLKKDKLSPWMAHILAGSMQWLWVLTWVMLKKYPKIKGRFSWEELKRGCTLFKHTRHAVSLNKFIIHLINYERVYTKFNFFALIYWKDMKLGGYDMHICTNRSLASCQSFFNIRLLTSWKSLTSQITFCNVKCSRFCKIWRTDYLKENVENNRVFFKKCDVTRCWPRP